MIVPNERGWLGMCPRLLVIECFHFIKKIVTIRKTQTIISDTICLFSWTPQQSSRRDFVLYFYFSRFTCHVCEHICQHISQNHSKTCLWRSSSLQNTIFVQNRFECWQCVITRLYRRTKKNPSGFVTCLTGSIDPPVVTDVTRWSLLVNS